MKQVLGANFADHSDLNAPGKETICTGCQSIMSGRPGRNPPPLRMVSFRLKPKCSFEFLEQADWWPIIKAGPASPEILSWGRTKKKHHALNAGISGNGFWRIGSDEIQIADWHDDAVIEALEILRSCGASKAAILTGRYRPQSLQKFSDEIDRSEKTIKRLRGKPILEWMVWALPSEPEKRKDGTSMALDSNDRIAVDLLAAVAWASDYRKQDGLRFWDGYFMARVNRFSRLPLPDFTSNLMRDAQVPAIYAHEAARLVDSLDADTEKSVMESITKRGTMLMGLVYDEMGKRRKDSAGKKKGEDYED